MEPLQIGAKGEVGGIERGGRPCAAASRFPGPHSPGETPRAIAGVLAAVFFLGCVALLGPAPAALGNEPVADAVGSPAAMELASLMSQFAAGRGMRVPFRESRQLAILRDPIESEGVFFFAPPGELARYTYGPGRSRILVQGDRVVFDDATGRQSFDLSSNEIARGFIDIFGVVLRGDLKELQRLFTLAFHVDGGTWKLEMRPRSRHLRHLVDRIEVEGRGPALKRMTMLDTHGDRTNIVFGKAVPLTELDPAERQKAFSLDSAGTLP